MNYFIHTNSFSVSGVDAMPCLPSPSKDNTIRIVRERVAMVPIIEALQTSAPPVKAIQAALCLSSG
jgi:hypothetical protein